jgi:hypothetical protein
VTEGTFQTDAFAFVAGLTEEEYNAAKCGIPDGLTTEALFIDWMKQNQQHVQILFKAMDKSGCALLHLGDHATAAQTALAMGRLQQFAEKAGMTLERAFV